MRKYNSSKLRENIDWYVSQGLLPPIGLLEEFKMLTGRDYKPDESIKRIYTIITGKKYE